MNFHWQISTTVCYNEYDLVMISIDRTGWLFIRSGYLLDFSNNSKHRFCESIDQQINLRDSFLIPKSTWLWGFE